MKKNYFFSVLILFVISVCVSAHTSIEEGSKHYFNAILNGFSDTTKTENNTDDHLHIDTINGWKTWKTIGNFTFGKDRGDIPMIADLNSLHPFFRDKINQLIINCKAKGIDLAIVESFRTHAKQTEYYTMGKKYTRSAGGKSKHQYGLAVDVVPIVDSVAVWDNAILWRKIGVEGEKLGLRWGGRWKSPYDPAHFEWTGGVTTAHLSNGMYPPLPEPALSLYPCIEEDLKQLKKYWEAWENEQQVVVRSHDNNKQASVMSQKP
jgi:hypothetical protein